MTRTAYVFLTFTALFWAGNAIAGSLAVGHISPATLVALRWAMAFAVLLAIGYRQFGKDWPVVKIYWKRLAALGFAGFAGFNIIFYTALQYTTAINVAIEQAAMPLVIMIANFLLFSTRVSALQIVGFTLSLIGVAVTVSHGELGRLLGLDVNRGDALMMVAVLLYGGYTVALRYKPDIHWQSLMIAMAFAAFLASLPYAAWEWRATGGQMPDAQGLMIAAYTAIFPSILAQVFYIRGNEIIGGNRASLFINFVPVFAAFLSIVILSVPLHTYHVIAMVLVLGGISLAERGGRKLAAASQPPT